MHIHFYAYSFLCIFITMHIHCHAYSFLSIFITMHIHFYTYSSMHIHDLTSPYLYKLLPKPFDRRTYTDRERTEEDRHVQIHTYDYRIYYRTESLLYVTTDYLVDSTINSVNANSFVVVTSHIAKQYFTRLHCDSSKLSCNSWRELRYFDITPSKAHFTRA